MLFKSLATVALLASSAVAITAIPSTTCVPTATACAVGTYQTPAATFHRSPCPALNAFANHGFINRNGSSITTAALGPVLAQVAGLDAQFIGTLFQLTAGALDASGNLDLLTLNTHNLLEHDASIVHDDTFFGPNYIVNKTKVAQLLALATNGNLSLANMATHKANQLAFSQFNNPTFDIPDSPIPLESLIQWAKAGLPFGLFGSNTVPVSFIQSFLGNEQLPNYWVFPPANSNSFVAAVTSGGQIAAMAVADEFASEPALSLPPVGYSSASTRAAALVAWQGKLSNAPYNFSVQSQLGGYKYYIGPRGPAPSVYVAAWGAIEAQDFVLRSKLDETAAENLIGFDIAASVLPIATLDQITALYQNFTSVIPVPASVNNWQLDASFGNDRLTWGGYSLKIETSNVLNIPDSLAITLTGSTVAQLLASNRLFKNDFSMMSKYSKSVVGEFNPYGQSVPGAYGQFYLDSSNNMQPLAIQINKALVYTPADGAQDWMFAKLAFGVAEANYIPWEHFSVSHWQLIAIRVEQFRHLSNVHPVYALLEHHLTESFGVIVGGIQILLQNGTALDTYFGSGGQGASQFVGDRVASYNFAKQSILNSFASAGTFGVPGYKYRDDLLALRGAVFTFVESFLSLYYTSNAAVISDIELQAWAAAVASPSGGAVYGFPGAFYDVFCLATVITDIIVIVTGQHNVLNGNSFWDYQVPPARSHAIYGPYPTAKGVVTNARNYLAPAAPLLAAEIAFQAAFRVPAVQFQLLGHSYGTLLGASANPLVGAFQANLAAISANIEAREKGSARPFVSLDPANIPYQSWV